MLPLLLLTIEDPDRREEYAAAYRKYRQHMFVVANLILKDEAAAEDAVQNAFYSIIRNDSLPALAESDSLPRTTSAEDFGAGTADSVSESANPNQDPVSDRIKVFLTIVVRNKAIDLLRKDSRIAAEAPTDQQLGITAPADGTDVEQTIASLPAQYRDILINFYYVGLNAKEIAQQEGVHQHTILRRLKKAEQLFKEEYLRDR